MDHEAAALLANYPVVIDVPVWWGDQDAFGHVNNTVPIRWFESARIAYCARVGLWELIEREKIGPIVASITCHYRRPLFFPDTVHVGARVVRIGRSSLTMEHAAVSAGQRLVAADGTSALVVYDYGASVPHPVPEAIRRAIEALERKSLS